MPPDSCERTEQYLETAVYGPAIEERASAHQGVKVLGAGEYETPHTVQRVLPIPELVFIPGGLLAFTTRQLLVPPLGPTNL